jgi:ketosteroid isomerase-like protein
MITNKNLQRAAVLSFAALLPSLTWAADMGNDQKKVVDTMTSLFAALGHDDVDQYHRITCPDFYIFDRGQQMSRDQLMGMMKKAHASGSSFVWQITQPQVHIGGDTAWMTYINQGSITSSAGTKPMKWVESAVFSRTADGWCVRFAHSTRMTND